MPLTNFPNGISSFGVPTVGGAGIPVTTGRYIFVDSVNGLDGNDGSSPQEAVLTIAHALSLTTDGNNDVILLSANGTSHKLTAMLKVTNSKVHFVGLDGGGRIIGPRAFVETSGAGAATDVAMIQVTGRGCSFRNIKFSDSFSIGNNVCCVSDCAQNTLWVNCDIEAIGTGHVATAADASLICSGAECVYLNCTIGQHTTLTTSTGGQQMLITRQTIGTTTYLAGNCVFQNCIFQAYTSDTTHTFIRASGNGINSTTMNFIDCTFDNRGTTAVSGVTLAVAVATSTPGGNLNFSYPRTFGCTDFGTAAAGNTGVYVLSPILTPTGDDLVAIQPT